MVAANLVLLRCRVVRTRVISAAVGIGVGVPDSYFEKHALIQRNGIFGVTLFDFTSGNLDYIGSHIDSSAATSVGGWHVWKFTYDGSNNVLRIEKLLGIYDDRAGFSWR